MQRHAGSSLRGLQGGLAQHHCSPRVAVADSIRFVDVAFMLLEDDACDDFLVQHDADDWIRNVNYSFLLFGSLWDFIKKKCCIIAHGISSGAVLCSVTQVVSNSLWPHGL